MDRNPHRKSYPTSGYHPAHMTSSSRSPSRRQNQHDDDCYYVVSSPAYDNHGRGASHSPVPRRREAGDRVTKERNPYRPISRHRPYHNSTTRSRSPGGRSSYQRRRSHSRVSKWRLSADRRLAGGNRSSDPKEEDLKSSHNGPSATFPVQPGELDHSGSMKQNATPAENRNPPVKQQIPPAKSQNLATSNQTPPTSNQNHPTTSTQHINRDSQIFANCTIKAVTVYQSKPSPFVSFSNCDIGTVTVHDRPAASTASTRRDGYTYTNLITIQNSHGGFHAYTAPKCANAEGRR